MLSVVKDYTVERTPEGDFRFSVKIDIPTVEKKVDQIVRAASREIAIPGFRKGKTPRSIIEKRVGREALYEEAKSELLKEAFMDLVLDQAIQPLDHKIIEMTLNPGEEAQLELEIKPTPILELKDYKNFEVTIPAKKEVEEEHIDTVINQFQKKHATLQAVEDRQTPAEDDFAVISYQSFFTDNDEVVPDGKQDNILVDLSDKAILAPIKENLLEMKIGETRNVEMDYPESSESESVSGRKVRMEIALNGIKTAEIPEMTDELAKESGFESLSQFRENVRRRLEGELEKEYQNQLQSAVYQKILEANPLEVPQDMIDMELENMISEHRSTVENHGLEFEKYLQSVNENLDSMKEKLTPSAVWESKIQIVLDSIARSENITVSDQELDSAISMASPGEKLAAVKKRLQNSGAIVIVKRRLLHNKAREWWFDSITVNHQEPEADDAASEVAATGE